MAAILPVLILEQVLLSTDKFTQDQTAIFFTLPGALNSAQLLLNKHAQEGKNFLRR